jgi:DNA invertase Pin-like site-specific DNA recombinase
MPVAYSYIRFSSTAQKDGDSLDRQLKLVNGWVQRHGLALDTSLTLHDLGYSAYKRRNLEKGALGVFMAQVAKGRIKPGSFLLVESLDRISRTKPYDALKLFQSIIDAGITIVTMLDEKVYSRESIDKSIGSLTDSINIMARAHDESATKSDRVTRSWEKRREKARTGGMKLTQKCPRWLKLSDDRTEYVVIPEAAAVVERIFKMIIEGHGTQMIEYTFNREKVPTFGRKKLWNRNAILKIINNRWVLGEYQPMLVKGTTRIPAGDPINDYYPRIISDEIYRTARHVMDAKRRVAKGRKGNTIGNLLTGLCKCGYCGGPVVFIDKGQKSGPYLICSHAKMGDECNSTRWEYTDVERSLMTVTRELRVEDLSSNQNQAAHLV